MSTIQELEQKIQRLEKQILANDLKGRELLEKSEKAMECAKHAYKVDHYGFIWVWDVNKGEYRKSNMRVMTPEIADRALESRNIADNAIEGRHMTDNLIEGRMIKNRTIEGRSIQNDAISTEKIQDLSITGDNMPPRAVPNGKLADNAVSERNIQDHNVTKNKLSTELISLIYSAGEHGYHLSNEFGDSPVIGVSQKTITEAFNRLWQKIGDITGEVLQGISMSVTPDYFIGNDGADVHVTANATSLSGVFEVIWFSRWDSVLREWVKIIPEGREEAEYYDVDMVEFDTHIDDTTIIRCDAKILGHPYHQEHAVTRYSEFWMGAGSDYTDLLVDGHLTDEHNFGITRFLRGQYDIAAAAGERIIIILGDTLRQAFLRADISFTEIHFTEQEVTIDDKTYIVLTSEDTYDAGTYRVFING